MYCFSLTRLLSDATPSREAECPQRSHVRQPEGALVSQVHGTPGNPRTRVPHRCTCRHSRMRHPQSPLSQLIATCSSTNTLRPCPTCQSWSTFRSVPIRSPARAHLALGPEPSRYTGTEHRERQPRVQAMRRSIRRSKNIRFPPAESRSDRSSWEISPTTATLTRSVHLAGLPSSSRIA